MKTSFKTAASAAIVLACAASAHAQLLYSFEGATPPDGFGPNGGGVTITQTATGVTNGSSALNVAVVGGATFVGALTGNIPATLNAPLPVEQITFDYTIGTQYAGNFADVGITIFGASQANYPGGQQFGLQAQFADIEALETKTPGTYTATIDLTSATNPLTFDTGDYNSIFGSGANQLIPTGFEFFVSKSNTAPITFQIDNVRLVQAPEPATLAAIAGAGGMLVRRRRRAM